MNFSIVIPTYNRRPLLKRALTAALAQTAADYEVIVVDDGSTDGSREMVRADFPLVKLIEMPTNQGPAAARNKGIEAAVGEVIVFTDDDCLLPPDFLNAIAQGYQSFPEVVGVGGYLGAEDAVIASNVFAQFEAYRTHDVYGAGPEPIVGGMEVPGGGTNSMSYTKAVLLEVGGFDPVFPVPGGEDTDLKKRITDLGYLVLYIPAKVTHLQEYNFSGFWKQYKTHGRGVVYFEEKHVGQKPTVVRLLLRFGIRTVRWFRDLVQHGPRLASIIWIAQIADVYGQWLELSRQQGVSSR